MELIVPLSADLPYFIFCLTFCPDQKKVIIERAKSMLQDEMWQGNMPPGRVFQWMNFIEYGIDNGFFEVYEFRNGVQQLNAIKRQSHACAMRQQLRDVLSKQHERLLGTDDVPHIQHCIDEIDIGNVTEAELGFARSTLCIMIKQIVNGDYLQATA